MDEVGAITTVLGVDDDARRADLVAAIEAGGGEIVGESTMGRILAALTEVIRPALVVVDPDIAGPLSKRLVPRLLDAAPTATIAVLGPLVVPSSVELDRVRVIDDLDRELTALVAELASAVRAPAPGEEAAVPA